MKTKILLTFLLCSFISSIMHAQLPNYFTYKSEMNHYYDSLIQVNGSSNMSGTGYTQFKRFEARYAKDMMNSTGDFNTLFNNQKLLFQNLTSFNSSY